MPALVKLEDSTPTANVAHSFSFKATVITCLVLTTLFSLSNLVLTATSLASGGNNIFVKYPGTNGRMLSELGSEEAMNLVGGVLADAKGVEVATRSAMQAIDATALPALKDVINFGALRNVHTHDGMAFAITGTNWRNTSSMDVLLAHHRLLRIEKGLSNLYHFDNNADLMAATAMDHLDHASRGRKLCVFNCGNGNSVSIW